MGYEGCGSLTSDPIVKLILRAPGCVIYHAYDNGSCNPCWVEYELLDTPNELYAPQVSGVADFYDPLEKPVWTSSSTLDTRFKNDATTLPLTATLDPCNPPFASNNAWTSEVYHWTTPLETPPDCDNSPETCMSGATFLKNLADNQCNDEFKYGTYGTPGIHYVGVKMTYSTYTVAHVQAFEVIDPCLANDWTLTPTTFTYTDYDYFNKQNFASLSL